MIEQKIKIQRKGVKRKMKKENIKFQRNSQEKGITLVALVITIVILIILATVAINFAFGGDGLIRRAEQASEFYANDTEYTDESISNVTSYVDGVLSGLGIDAGGDEPEGGDTPTTVAEAIENEYVFTGKTTIKDALNNTIYVPGGFHLDKESNTDEEGNAITVEDGIVIEDGQGNQFVWIPTGAYQTSSGAKTNELTRRQWGSANSNTEPTPRSGDSVINSYYYGEGATQNEDGEPITPVKTNIEGFKTSATNNGGFYIGRYEQGEGNVCKAEVNAYVDVTRDEAKEAAESMYSEDTESEVTATTELISSYAWDTALNFICQNSEYGYELATTTSSERGNIGTSNKTTTGGYEADCYSNIYDFLGNCYEWTTGYSSNTDSDGVYPCVTRGGYCDYSNDYAAFRGYDTSDSSYYGNSFRLQLYV